MGQIFAQHKTVLLGIAALLVLGVAWYGFGSRGTESTLLATQTVSELGNAAGRDVVETLLTLRAVSLGGSILSDPAFMSLKDFGTQIVPEPVGRPNPFAPFSSDVESDAKGGVPARLFAPGTGQ